MRRLLATIALSGLVASALGVPRAAAQTVGEYAVGIEMGLPLVVGLDLSARLNPRLRLGIAAGQLSGFTALRAEARWLLRAEVPERVTPSLIVGAEQYFLEDDGRSATPLGVHAALGLGYHFASPVAVGARLGLLHTFGSSDSGDLKVFSVENGYTTGTFSLDVRYHF